MLKEAIQAHRRLLSLFAVPIKVAVAWFHDYLPPFCRKRFSEDTFRLLFVPGIPDCRWLLRIGNPLMIDSVLFVSPGS